MQGNVDVNLVIRSSYALHKDDGADKDVLAMQHMIMASGNALQEVRRPVNAVRGGFGSSCLSL
jgi:hypothetical protein